MKKIILSLFIAIAILSINNCNNKENNNSDSVKNANLVDTLASEEDLWKVPDTNDIPDNEFGELVRYGRQLIVNTAYYIGPEGKVGKYLGNKMNCTNCHLEAGTKPYAFNFFSTHARYPQYRARENKVLNLGARINNCIERPHIGKHLPLDSKEIIAIQCYMKWLCEKVPVNGHVKGDGPLKVKYPDRAADPIKGEVIYKRDCAVCHGANGEGKMRLDNVCYENPPLWGDKAYQAGSSVHRVLKLGVFIYANMPNKIASYDKPKLTIEEAFDVSAFINDDAIHSRPQPITKNDYPNIKTKPNDYGTGPFQDSFPVSQHKFGPYQPIIDYYKSIGKEAKF